MADLYIQLTYDEWKQLEDQCKSFQETTHGEGSEYYHKSFRIKVGGTSWEFHAPIVKARFPNAS